MFGFFFFFALLGFLVDQNAFNSSNSLAEMEQSAVLSFRCNGEALNCTCRLVSNRTRVLASRHNDWQDFPLSQHGGDECTGKFQMVAVVEFEHCKSLHLGHASGIKCRSVDRPSALLDTKTHKGSNTGTQVS